MMRMSSRDNEGGFALVDAMIALFISGIAVIAICGALSVSDRVASSGLSRTSGEIERRNAVADAFMGEYAAK